MKKTVSLILAVIMTLGMAGTAYGASGSITDINKAITSRDLEDLDIEPGYVLELPLTADMFEWSGDSGDASDNVTTSQLSSAKIDVKAKYTKKSGDYVKSVSIESKKINGVSKAAYVKIAFVDNLTTDEVDFEFTVYLTMKGSRKSNSEITVAGTMSRETVEVDEDQEYVDISNGELATSDYYIRSMEFYIGEGVIIKYKMYESKKYYGSVDRGIKEADEDVVDAYPEISTVLRLNTNITGGTVMFELDDTYHVYDADGKYVGTTDDELAYSKVFYLADEKIALDGGSSSSSSKARDVDDDDDDDDEKVTEAPSSSSTPDYEQDYYGSVNGVNDNPSTGSGGLANVLAVSGLSVIAIFCTSNRKKTK